MNKDEIKQNLDRAYKLISSIAVKDLDVDAMFAAKQALRRAYELIEKEGDADGGQTDQRITSRF